MNWYLDTNICIDFLRGRNVHLAERFFRHQPDDVKIPSIVKAELLVGAHKSRKLEENLRIVLTFLENFEIIPFDDRAAMDYGLIRSSLEVSGENIGPNDLIVASTVLSRRGVLVTHNTREFSRIPSLSLEDWTE